MAGKRLKEYRLYPAALADLDLVWDYTVQTWSTQQAETYIRGLAEALEAIARYPEIARERKEITPPIRLYAYQSHLIIYRIEKEFVAIIRIVHASRHWQALLED